MKIKVKSASIFMKMDINNPLPPGEGMPSGQNEIGHLFHAGHSYGNSYNRPPPFWRPPPPPPQLCGYGPRPFPFAPFHPFGCVPPMFNVPPPLTSSEQSSVTPSTNEDKAWLQNWLQFRPLKEQHKIAPQEGLSISAAQSKLRHWIETLKDLKDNYDHLHKIVSLPAKEWSDVWSTVAVKKLEISKLMNSFNGKALENLRRKHVKQVNKRTRLKRRQAEQKKEVYLAQLRCQRLHQKADAWLADMQLTVDRARKDEKLKKEADSVLSEVTRRQSDGRRQVALLEALQKLHQARLQDIEARGNKLCGEEKQAASHSTKVLNHLLTLWSKKMEEYAKEEHALRVMLEESAAKQSDLEIQNTRHILTEWEKCLFGPDSADSLFDINTLVSIRHAWDQYMVPEGLVVPMASTIPVGWVLPTTPSSSEWQQYLFKK